MNAAAQPPECEPDMTRSILISGLAIAAAAVALQWLNYRYAVRALSTDSYIGLLALGFTVLGVWAGYRLTLGRTDHRIPRERNTRAIASLGISERELAVLELLAAGHSNKEIADRLFVSPHTVKTHVGHLYDKLEVARRTEAVQKARMLGIL
jgi:DNA-binding CsgD family transcriptional regulator